MKARYLILMSAILVLALLLATGCTQRPELVVTANDRVISGGDLITISKDEPDMEFKIPGYIPGTSNGCSWIFDPVGTVEQGDPTQQGPGGGAIIDQLDLIALDLKPGLYWVTAAYTYFDQSIRFRLRVVE